jgi:hypothetical protein
MKIAGLLICAAVAAASAWLLATGSDWLEVALPFAFPAGNLVAAAMLVALAAIPRLLARQGSKLRIASKWLLAAAIAWLPLSMALAGGMQLSYSGWVGWAWMAYTLTLLLALPAMLGWAIVAALLPRRGATTDTTP